MYASMMPRAFLVKTAPERARHDLMTSHYDLMMTSLDLHQHHHHQQQQERNTSSAFSLMTSFDRAAVDDPMTTYEQANSHRLQSYLYHQLWSTIIARSNNVLQHRLPVVTSSPIDVTSHVTSQQSSSKFNPFINSPPLTADVDTNRLYPRINGNSGAKTSPSYSKPVTVAGPTRFNASKANSCYSMSSTARRLHGGVIPDVIPLNSAQFSKKISTDSAAITSQGGHYAPALSRLARDSRVTVVPDTPARFRCAACQKSYSTVGGLSKHREFHCRALLATDPPRQPPQPATVKDLQRCPQCDKAYTSASALKMHIRTHTLPCRCRLCGKAFSRPWLLQGHVRTHTGEKPFTCPYCQRAFADRSNLRAHLQTHYDVKQYHCDVCRRTFSRMSLLLKHRYASACAVAADTNA